MLAWLQRGVNSSRFKSIHDTIVNWVLKDVHGFSPPKDSLPPSEQSCVSLGVFYFSFDLAAFILSFWWLPLACGEIGDSEAGRQCSLSQPPALQTAGKSLLCFSCISTECHPRIFSKASATNFISERHDADNNLWIMSWLIYDRADEHSWVKHDNQE